MVSQPSPTDSPHAESNQPLGRRLVTARVWSLLTSLRLSADTVYRREMGIVELDRRLLITIEAAGEATPLALTATLGHDKAQMSRALKRLEQSGLVHRSGLRGPVTLSKEGAKVTQRMLEIAARRNVSLLDGVEPADVEAFRDLVRRLTERSIALFARERALAGDDGRCAEPLPLESSQQRNALLASALLSLLVYMMRSAALSYKRLTGLSTFDWQVLSQVAEHAPLPLARMILMLGRDKGQAGRTIKRLEELGLVARRRTEGKRAVLLEPTAKGSNVYAAMAEHAMERNAFVTAGISQRALRRFLATLDRLTANAERMLEATRDD